MKQQKHKDHSKVDLLLLQDMEDMVTGTAHSRPPGKYL